jgi:Arc/MetJ-type ribon-helix-helix transcriptional regulator
MAESKLFQFKANAIDAGRVEALQQAWGRETAADVIRQAVRRAHAEHLREEERRKDSQPRAAALLKRLRDAGESFGDKAVMVEHRQVEFIAVVSGDTTFFEEPNGELVGMRTLEDGRTQRVELPSAAETTQ